MVRKSKAWMYILVFLIAVALVIAIIFGIYYTKNISYAAEVNETKLVTEVPITKKDKEKEINIDEIVENNTKVQKIEKLETQETDIEFTTQYIENTSLAKGKIQVLQEGIDGKQNAVLKNVYEGDKLISSVQVSSQITKASIDKIVQIGTGAYSNTYVPVVGDELKATSVTLAIRINPDENAEKLVTINKGDKVTLKAKQGDWYYVAYENYLGWAKMDCLEYVNPNGTGDGDENNIFSPETRADHAVQVIGIDRTDPACPMVVLNDSGTPNGCGELVPLDVFENAWNAGDSQMIIC